MSPSNTSVKSEKLSKIDWTQNPVVTEHAKNRVHERFGIPIKKAAKWIRKKLSAAQYIRDIPNGKLGKRSHAYLAGGAILIMRGRAVITVAQVNPNMAITNQVVGIMSEQDDQP